MLRPGAVGMRGPTAISTTTAMHDIEYPPARAGYVLYRSCTLCLRGRLVSTSAADDLDFDRDLAHVCNLDVFFPGRVRLWRLQRDRRFSLESGFRPFRGVCLDNILKIPGQAGRRAGKSSGGRAGGGRGLLVGLTS